MVIKKRIAWNKGKKCPPKNWKYKKQKTSHGYIKIQKGYKGEEKYEHRLIMEKYLGRKLEHNELVHHKNGIKTDNRIENLELTSIKQHLIGHLSKRKIVKCSYCYKDIERMNWRIKKFKHHFCNRRCYLNFVRKIHALNKFQKVGKNKLT